MQSDFFFIFPASSNIIRSLHEYIDVCIDIAILKLLFQSDYKSLLLQFWWILELQSNRPVSSLPHLNKLKTLFRVGGVLRLFYFFSNTHQPACFSSPITASLPSEGNAVALFVLEVNVTANSLPFISAAYFYEWHFSGDKSQFSNVRLQMICKLCLTIYFLGLRIWNPYFRASNHVVLPNMF